jgi:hypothetical protein
MIGILEYWKNGMLGKIFEKQKGLRLYSKNPLFHYSIIPSFQVEGIGNFYRNLIFDSLNSYYISVIMMAFDLHTAVHVRHPRQF